jgi:hypothetical protein
MNKQSWHIMKDDAWRIGFDACIVFDSSVVYQKGVGCLWKGPPTCLVVNGMECAASIC